MDIPGHVLPWLKCIGSIIMYIGWMLNSAQGRYKENDLIFAMNGHVLQYGDIIVFYRKKTETGGLLIRTTPVSLPEKETTVRCLRKKVLVTVLS